MTWPMKVLFARKVSKTEVAAFSYDENADSRKLPRRMVPNSKDHLATAYSNTTSLKHQLTLVLINGNRDGTVFPRTTINTGWLA